MKKIYGFLLISAFINPMIMYGMEQREAQRLGVAWWNVKTWSRNQKIAAGTLIAAALAVFGSYKATIAHAKNVIKQSILEEKFNPTNKTETRLLNRWKNCRQIPTSPIINKLVNERINKMTWQDIAFEALAYPIRKFEPRFPW